MTRSGVPMQRLRERQRVSPPPERIAYLRDRGVELLAQSAALEAAEASETAEAAAVVAADAAADAADALGDAADALLAADQIVDGTTPFTALNMAGTDVAPFLAKTDGERLIDSDALDDGVVVTQTIAVDAVTSADFDYEAGTIDGKTTSPVVLATRSVTVLDGESVDLLGNCSIASVGSGTGATVTAVGRLFVYRDAVALTASERYGGVVIRGVAYGVSATTAVTDEPAAGTHTYTLVSLLDTTSDVSTYEISNRYLRATRRKR